MNKVVMIGNLCADPEMQYVAGGQTARCTFRLAVQRRVLNKQGVREADFISVTCWKSTAESVAKYLRKGNKCAVVGSLQTRSYDAQDGTKRYVAEVVADEVEFLSRPDGAERAELKPDEPPKEFVAVDDDELPF